MEEVKLGHNGQLNRGFWLGSRVSLFYLLLTKNSKHKNEAKSYIQVEERLMNRSINHQAINKYKYHG